MRAWLTQFFLRWEGRKPRPWLRSLVFLGVIVLVAVIITSGWSLATGGLFPGVERKCEEAGFSCGAVIELASTALIFILALAALLLWRVHLVGYRYVKKAREEPADLLPTATHLPKGVAGREGLCDIIEGDLRDLRGRGRAQVVVGSIGAGKTAVLVRLTQLLAECGAVPVPVRLSDAVEHDLDFRELAKRRFARHIDQWAVSEDEADQIWRKLCESGRVVILGDGLDELLQRPGISTERVRHAIEETKLRMVIASRPDNVLAGLDAALVELEPLPANEAVEYIAPRGGTDGEVESEDDRAQVADLVRHARLPETPIYLRIARELRDEGELSRLPVPKDSLSARVALLDRWTDRRPRSTGPWEIPLDREEYDRAIAGLERMACAALGKNRIDVDFDEIEDTAYVEGSSDLEDNPELVAYWGDRLEVVEALSPDRSPGQRSSGGDSGGARFMDSQLQAYLAARGFEKLLRCRREGSDGANGGRGLLPNAIIAWGRRELPVLSARPPWGVLDDALSKERPARELLMAIVMCCQRTKDRGVQQALRKRVMKAAKEMMNKPKDRPPGAEAFDLISAAYQVDKAVEGEGSEDLGEITRRTWELSRHEANAAAARSHPVAEAKLRAIASIAASGGSDAYRTLWHICEEEESYRVRLSAAQVFAVGGDPAFEAVRGTADDLAGIRDRLARGGGADGATRDDVRRASLLGWTLPVLASQSRELRREARRLLRRWIRSEERGAHLGVEGCLAQGFKLEANRRPPAGRGVGSRKALIELAEEFIEGTSWWYSKVSLLQAFALWSLPAEDSTQARLLERIRGHKRGQHPFVQETARLCERAITSHHRIPIQRTAAELSEYQPSRFLWIDEVGVTARIGAHRQEPREIVAAPQWLTEAVGWRALEPRARQLVGDILLLLNLIERGNRLHPELDDDRAGERLEPEERENRVVRAREKRRRDVERLGDELPTCLATVDRLSLLAVKGKKRHKVGACCKCEFRLCPYPRRDEQIFRGELRETFCRAQLRALRLRDKKGRRTRIPPWQIDNPIARHLLGPRSRKRLKEFWTQMESRAQG